MDAETGAVATLAKVLEAAKEEVFRVCREGWRMSIPVREDLDSDRIILRALDAAIRALATPAPSVAPASEPTLLQELASMGSSGAITVAPKEPVRAPASEVGDEEKAERIVADTLRDHAGAALPAHWPKPWVHAIAQTLAAERAAAYALGKATASSAALERAAQIIRCRIATCPPQCVCGWCVEAEAILSEVRALAEEPRDA